MSKLRIFVCVALLVYIAGCREFRMLKYFSVPKFHDLKHNKVKIFWVNFIAFYGMVFYKNSYFFWYEITKKHELQNDQINMAVLYLNPLKMDAIVQ